MEVDMRAGISNFRGRSMAAHVNLPEALSFKVDGLIESRGKNPLAGTIQIEKYGDYRRQIADAALCLGSVDNPTSNINNHRNGPIGSGSSKLARGFVQLGSGC